MSQYLPLSEQQVGQLMDRIRDRLPMATDFGEAEPKTEALGLGAAARLILTTYTPASEDDIAAYREASYPRWLEDCEDRLRRLHLGLGWKEGFPTLCYEIENQGSRPAEDAAITFEAKGAFSLEAPNDNTQGDPARVLALPPPPAPPRGTRRERPSLFGSLSLYQDAARATPIFDHPHMPDLVSPDPNAFYWHPSRPKKPQAAVSLRCKQWRHRIGPEPFTLVATFPRTAGTIQGAVHVSVHAANLTTPFKRIDAVEFEVVAVDTWPEAQALVEMLINRRGKE